MIALNTGIFLTCELSRNVWCDTQILKSKKWAYCTEVQLLDFQSKIILEKSQPDIFVFPLIGTNIEVIYIYIYIYM